MKEKTKKRRSLFPRKVLRDAFNPFLFLVGLCAVSFPIDRSSEILNICRKNGINFRRLTAYESREGRRGAFSLLLSDHKKLCQAFGEDCPIRLEKSVGIPMLLKRYRYRPGIFIGIVIMILIIFISFGFVWDIRISGNDTISDLDIIRELGTAGLTTGKRIASLDIDEIENTMLKASDKISWISINLRGTVANIEVREKTEKPQQASKKPSNLIASEKGEVVLLEVYSGKVAVKIGDIVNVGDILVSGIYDSQSLGVRFRRSVGSVFARTEHIIEIEIPYEYTEKVYTGKKITESQLFFFSNLIKFSKNYGNIPHTCDKISTRSIMTLIRGKNLPVILESVTYLEYVEEDRQRSADEACLIAFNRLEEELYTYTKDSQLLSKNISTDIGEESVKLTCHITIIEDIAKTQEFDFEFN